MELATHARRAWNLATLWRRERPAVGATPHDVVHRERQWRLLRYRPQGDGPSFRTPILLVPSLINRHYVLDLLPGKSFAEYLVQRGHDVYCLDWGRPGPEDRHLSFEEIVDRFLGRAVRIAARGGDSGGVHLLGYCMGGTLAAIHAGLRGDRLASLVALGAPVRFREGGQLAAWTRTRRFDVDALVDGCGNVPWPLMQGAFHLLRPTLNLAKAVNLVDRAWNDRFLDGFLALETWANDNVSMPGEFYRTYIRDLYRGDRFDEGTFALSGRSTRMEDITCPTLTIAFEHDHITPPKSAEPLSERAGTSDRDYWAIPGSHVGGVTSSAAAKTLWPELAAWWEARDDADGLEAKPSRAA